LVGSGLVAKVADFGMSRDISSDGKYVKTTEVRFFLSYIFFLILIFFATPQIKMKTIQEKIERMDLTMARRPKGNYEAYIN